MTLITDIDALFIPHQERSFNPSFEPGVIELAIDRDGEIIRSGFYRTGLVFSIRASEIEKWHEALVEAGFDWKIKQICKVLRGEGFAATDYSDRDAGVITSVINGNDGLKVVLAGAFGDKIDRVTG